MKPRPIREIQYAPLFVRNFRKLTPKEKVIAYQKEDIFRQNAFDQKLRTHKLKGGVKDKWSFSITYSHRVIFKFIDQDTALFYDIGSHDIYK